MSERLWINSKRRITARKPTEITPIIVVRKLSWVWQALLQMFKIRFYCVVSIYPCDNLNPDLIVLNQIPFRACTRYKIWYWIVSTCHTRVIFRWLHDFDKRTVCLNTQLEAVNFHHERIRYTNPFSHANNLNHYIAYCIVYAHF